MVNEIRMEDRNFVIINILKGIAIYLVVLGHTIQYIGGGYNVQCVI